MKSSRCNLLSNSCLLRIGQRYFRFMSLFAIDILVSWQENQDLLIRCIAQHLGFAGNRPVAACIIYKCLLHWRSFEVERTSVFDRIIQTIGHAIEVLTMRFNLIISLSLSTVILNYHFLCLADTGQ